MESPPPSHRAPSLGRGTLTMFLGRGVILALSLISLFLFPALLGPEAHGWFQYYLSLQLFLLGFLNGCAAPIAAHYVALYRVSDPIRQGILLNQVFRWFIFLFVSIALLYFVLPDRRGYWWIYVSVGLSGCSQMLSSALYGLGHLGAITWFPVLSLVVKMALICGASGWVIDSLDASQMESWGIENLPLLLVLSTIPSWIWMVVLFIANRPSWFHHGHENHQGNDSLFPWEEIRDFGFAALLGQIIFQSFTRSLTVLAGQMGYPAAQVGYLGLSTQAFGQVIFIAGFFSVALYPWLVSAGGEKDWVRFSRLQSVAWRLSAFLGGWLVVGTLVLIYPAVWVFLPDYRGDIDLFVRLVQVGVLGGAIILAGEFHLRMLVSLTRMREYLIALSLGFVLALGFVIWVAWTERDIFFFSLTLLVGSLGMTALSVAFSPKTEGFWKSNALAFLGILISGLAAYPFRGVTVRSMVVQGAILSLVYLGWSWGVGLFGTEDLDRVRSGSRGNGREG